MKPWIEIDQTTVPGSASIMQLLRRDKELVIRVDGQTLMSSRMHGSEDMPWLSAAMDQLRSNAPAVLIGGLGMGFTTKAALAVIPESARVKWPNGTSRHQLE